MKMLNLTHDWLRAYVPHCLAKIDRVTFGIMNKEDTLRAKEIDPYMPESRFKLAIPFIGKVHNYRTLCPFFFMESCAGCSQPIV